MLSFRFTLYISLVISTRSNASDHVSSSKRTKHEGKNRQMDILVERIRSKNTGSFTNGPITRKAVLGATFAKSKRPASLFQGYHQRTKHVGSDFSLVPHRGRDIAKYTVKRCSGLEANETGDNPNNALAKLNNGIPGEDQEAIVSSELRLLALDLMQLLVGWYFYTVAK